MSPSPSLLMIPSSIRRSTLKMSPGSFSRSFRLTIELLLKDIGEAAFRKTAVKRHLAAFKSAHDAVTGDGTRALMHHGSRFCPGPEPIPRPMRFFRCFCPAGGLSELRFIAFNILISLPAPANAGSSSRTRGTPGYPAVPQSGSSCATPAPAQLLCAFPACNIGLRISLIRIFASVVSDMLTSSPV